MHAAYLGLSSAERKLLVRAKCLARLVVLRQKETEEETEKALVGNTIMLAHPRTSKIVAELPLSVEEQLPFFNVVVSRSKSQIAKLKAFRIRREHYETCAKIRQEVCPTFAHVRMTDASAALPEVDVPDHVVNAGLAMETRADLPPSFLWPPSLRDPAAE